MKRSIERIINELQHDSKIQAMHRANVAKRQALRERRRALMLARRNKHLPMAFDSIEAVEVNAAEWLDLRIAEAIRRIESTGCDWLDYLQDHDANENVQAEFLRVWCDGYLSNKQPDAKSYSVADGITVLHPNTFGEWLDLGSHWTDEIIAQQVAEIKEGENPRIIAAKALAEQAKAMYDAAMNFDNAA
ncbi:hypothetical protein [Escherichia coli]|uniref:hypothetical protein n=1 Tax=Escherichia coli TaxID=562 RepID=UPI00200C657B|nr:hypothetical protein [Escherichia coli]